MLSKKEYLEMTNEISYLKSRIILLEYNTKEERKEFLDDLKEFELKRYSDMIRTLTNLREKWEARRK